MPTRSSTSEYQPSPPISRLNSRKAGKVAARVNVANASSTSGVKPNMCVPPTGGDGRLFSRSNGLG